MRKVNKLFFIISFLILCISQSDAAYEPFEIDAIKVTNTLAANVNPNTVTEFNNINTTAVINTNTDVFTSVTTNGVVCEPGTYLVDVILYSNYSGANNNQRVNASVEITVDGVGTGIRAADGYLRASFNHNPLGHDEASTTAADVVSLSSSSKIGFNTLGLAFIAVAPAPAGQSILRIVMIDD